MNTEMLVTPPDGSMFYSSRKSLGFLNALSKLGDHISFREALTLVIDWAMDAESAEAIAYWLWQNKMNPEDDSFYVFAANLAYAFGNDGHLEPYDMEGFLDE
ncbi:hypothetical protein [Tunturiibacter gelidiferens]|uniref:hypothetical protein n=1 Tax=Tunturiibacter gelidiferens TaxID=3069689 RepID=UPI003D9B9FD0